MSSDGARRSAHTHNNVRRGQDSVLFPLAVFQTWQLELHLLPLSASKWKEVKRKPQSIQQGNTPSKSNYIKVFYHHYCWAVCHYNTKSASQVTNELYLCQSYTTFSIAHFDWDNSPKKAKVNKQIIFYSPDVGPSAGLCTIAVVAVMVCSGSVMCICGLSDRWAVRAWHTKLWDISSAEWEFTSASQCHLQRDGK